MIYGRKPNKAGQQNDIPQRKVFWTQKMSV